ncbi:MAG: flagellar protein FlaG [Clostridium sp.]|nr:flagellar protein FlaG [Clostridium sp.]
MGVEPLGSIMSLQAQSVSISKPAVQEARPANEDPTAVVQEVANVDKTTGAVEYTRSKDQGAEGGEQQQTKEQTSEQIKKAVEKLNKSLPHSEAIFGIHEATRRVTLKIVDKESKEVIKEFPPEKTLDMIAKVWELAGMLIDEKR